MEEAIKKANEIIEKARKEILESREMIGLTIPGLIDLLRAHNYWRQISEITIIHDDKIYSIQPLEDLFYYFRFSESTGYLIDVLLFYDVHDENRTFITSLSAWCQIQRSIVIRAPFEDYAKDFYGEYDSYESENYFNSSIEDESDKEMSPDLETLVAFNEQNQLKALRYADYIQKIFADDSVVKGDVRVSIGMKPDHLVHVVTMDTTVNQKIDMGFDEKGRLRQWVSETYTDDGKMDVSSTIFGEDDYEEE